MNGEMFDALNAIRKTRMVELDLARLARVAAGEAEEAAYERLADADEAYTRYICEQAGDKFHPAPRMRR